VKSLRADAVSTTQLVAIAIASTAPAYSIAATLALLVGAAGLAAPWALAAGVVPMLLVTLVFREFNSVEPDCGTVFAWASRAYGYRIGWITGWVSLMACILVMSSLAQIASAYALGLLGLDNVGDDSFVRGIVAMLVVGALTVIAARDIKLTARVQVILATVELSALLAFVGVALATAKDPASTPHSDTDWLMAILAATFLYWGWDSAFSLNEESRAPRQSPAIAALGANLALATVYVLVASAAIANAGTDALTVAGDDVFAALAGDLPGGSYTASVLSAIVLVSALASIQTTIIPSARIIFSMARSGLLPSRLAVAHPHHHSPYGATIFFAGLSMLVYVGLLSVSEELLSTAVEATAVLIAVYYASTCFAALMLFHRALPRRRVIQRCVIPILAGTFFLAVALTALARLDVSAFVAVVILSLGAVLAAVLPRPVTAPNRRVSAAITTGRW